MDTPKCGNIVFDQQSYPSSVLPWYLPLRSHLEKRFVSSRPDKFHYLEGFEKAIDHNTVAVCVSHVAQTNGFRHNLTHLSSLAHANDALIVVDGAQSAGAMSIDLHKTDVDFFSTTAMKWLLGAAGVGFLYVARRHHSKFPSRVGYRSAEIQANHDSILNDNARRFEIGMPSLLSLAFSRVGLNILLNTNLQTIEAHNLDLSGYCIYCLQTLGLNVITPESEEFRMGIVAINYDHSYDLWKHLRSMGIDTWHKGNLLRADMHLFNNREDIDKLVDAVKGYLQTA